MQKKKRINPLCPVSLSGLIRRVEATLCEPEMRSPVSRQVLRLLLEELGHGCGKSTSKSQGLTVTILDQGSSNEGTFVPQGTFDSVWRHFKFSRPWWRALDLVSHGWGLEKMAEEGMSPWPSPFLLPWNRSCERHPLPPEEWRPVLETGNLGLRSLQQGPRNLVKLTLPSYYLPISHP